MDSEDIILQRINQDPKTKGTKNKTSKKDSHLEANKLYTSVLFITTTE